MTITRHLRRLAVSSATIAGYFIGSAAVALAVTSIGTNMSTDGTLTVAGNAVFDTTTLVVDATNNRVGFGTTTPGVRAHLYDASGAHNRLYVETAGGSFGEAEITLKTPQNTWSWFADDNTNDHLPDSVLGLFSSDASTYVMMVGGDGKVGIGSPTSTAPLYQLHIEKNQNASTLIGVKNTTAGTGALSGLYAMTDGSVGTWLKSHSSTYTSTGLSLAGFGSLLTDIGMSGLVVGTAGAGDPLVFGTAGSERVRIDGNGNVGIGDTSPSALLSVGSGDVFTVDSSGNVVVNGNTDLGDATTDTVTFTAHVDSNIVPASNDLTDLGTSTLRWRHGYFGPGTVHIGDSGDEVQLTYDTTNDLLDITRGTLIDLIDANNATAVDLLTVRHRATTPANGIGASMLFQAQDTGSNIDDIARISAILTDATADAELGLLKFQVRDGASGLIGEMRFNGLGELEVPQVKINNTTAIKGHYSNTGTLGNSGANIAAGACIEMTLAVTGAAAGDSVVATPTSTIESGFLWSAYVSAADTVSVRLCNFSGAAVASANISWRVDVWKH